MKDNLYFAFESYLKHEKIYFEKEFFVKNLMPEPTKFKHSFKIDYVILTGNENCKYIAVEIEGGAWSNGRHTRGCGYINDILKYNSITCAGYPLIRFTSDMVINHPVKCVDYIKRYLNSNINTLLLSKFVTEFKIKQKQKKINKI